MNIAITGGTGFIGRKIVAYHLAKGDHVRILTRSPKPSKQTDNIEYISGDLTDPSSLQPLVDQADLLYHCAAELRDTTLMDACNHIGTANLIAQASGRIHRWIQLSSVGSYGPRRHQLVDETTPESPVGIYETSKTLADQLVRAATRQGAFTSCIVRPSTVFGNDMPNRSLAEWILSIHRRHFFFIGQPKAILNYIHVDSLIAAIILCGTSSTNGEAYIVSEFIDLQSLVKLICNTLDSSPPKTRINETLARAIASFGTKIHPRFPLTPSRVDALTNTTRYSSQKIHSELGFTPPVSIANGIQSLTQHIVDAGYAF